MLLTFLAIPASAVAQGCVVPPVVKGYEQLTVAASSVGLTVPAGTEAAVLRTEAAQIRWRDDGTAPTSTVGTILDSGDVVTICGQTLSAIRFIRTGGTSGVVNASFYGW